MVVAHPLRASSKETRAAMAFRDDSLRAAHPRQRALLSEQRRMGTGALASRLSTYDSVSPCVGWLCMRFLPGARWKMGFNNHRCGSPTALPHGPPERADVKGPGRPGVPLATMSGDVNRKVAQSAGILFTCMLLSPTSMVCVGARYTPKKVALPRFGGAALRSEDCGRARAWPPRAVTPPYVGRPCGWCNS